MKPRIILYCLAGLIVASVVAALAIGRLAQTARPQKSPLQTYHVRGQIRSVDIANGTVRITHEEIPGYMPAMTMPLSVKDASLLNGLGNGDQVAFDLAVTDDDSWIARLERIPASEPNTAPVTSVSLGELESERVQKGELVPDFQLLDQDGRSFTLSSLRGKAVLLTFIYTRCPLPNYCPLMSKNFSQLEQRLNAEFTNRFQLVSVSMDPDFDRPEVLKEYGARYGAQGNDWTFATGNPDQIKTVADLLGLYYVKENGLISHDLRTALIGPDGRLVHLWKSNVWTPYEVQRMVRETLTASKDVASK
jgi:protein SCO1/2